MEPLRTLLHQGESSMCRGKSGCGWVLLVLVFYLSGEYDGGWVDT